MLRALLELEKLQLPDWERFDRFVNTTPFTCGNCMLICWPDMKDRKENYRLLTKSGRVVKGDTGLTMVHV